MAYMKAIYKEQNTPTGEKVIIRTCTESDAETLIALKKSYIEGTTTIPLYAEEYKNGKSEEALINKYNNEKNSLLLLAEHNGMLIGNIDLTGNQRKKLFHTAVIGMGIHNDWQNKKIGSLLMEEAIKWSLLSPLQILWLEVYATNAGGIRLYEKFGFERCGIMKNFFREGRPIDKITMIKYL